MDKRSGNAWPPHSLGIDSPIQPSCAYCSNADFILTGNVTWPFTNLQPSLSPVALIGTNSCWANLAAISSTNKISLLSIDPSPVLTGPGISSIKKRISCSGAKYSGRFSVSMEILKSIKLTITPLFTI